MVTVLAAIALWGVKQAQPAAGPMSVPQTFVRAERMLRTAWIEGPFKKADWDLLFEKAETTRVLTTATATTTVPATTIIVPSSPAQNPPVQTPPAQTPPAQTPPAQTPPVKPAPGPGPLGGTPRQKPTSDPKIPAPTPATPPPATPTPAPEPVVPVTPPPPAPEGVQAAYLNWEPGIIYLAATVPAGNDLVVSIDGKNDGFLVGRDNLEIRVSGGKLVARVLDATNPAGPIWTPAPGFAESSRVSVTDGSGVSTVQIKLVDPGYGIVPAKLGDKFALRFDAVPSASAPTEPFIPRVTTSVKLVDQWTQELPNSFKVNVPAKGRGAFPGDSTVVHWQLNAVQGASLKRLSIEGEGWLNDYVSAVSVPSPDFDSKGNGNVDYETKVVRSAPVGYGVLKGKLVGDSWGPAEAEVSFRVPPPLDLEIPAKLLKRSDLAQKFKSTVEIRSNSDRKVEGHLQIIPPAGWTVKSGSDKNFYIYNRKGAVWNGFEIEVPPGVTGTFSVTLRIAAIGKIVDQPYWVTVQ